MQEMIFLKVGNPFFLSHFKSRAVRNQGKRGGGGSGTSSDSGSTSQLDFVSALKRKRKRIFSDKRSGKKKKVGAAILCRSSEVPNDKMLKFKL
jgi:hypothetical protein